MELSAWYHTKRFLGISMSTFKSTCEKKRSCKMVNIAKSSIQKLGWAGTMVWGRLHSDTICGKIDVELPGICISGHETISLGDLGFLLNQLLIPSRTSPPWDLNKALSMLKIVFISAYVFKTTHINFKMPFCQSFTGNFNINTCGVANIEIAGYVILKLNGWRKEIKPQQNFEVYDPEAVREMKKTTEYWHQICNRFLWNC